MPCVPRYATTLQIDWSNMQSSISESEVSDDGLLIIRGGEVASLLSGRELEIIQTIRSAYEVHRKGSTALPHSMFLRFPGDDRNRIIALPAYLGEQFEVAGL